MTIDPESTSRHGWRSSLPKLAFAAFALLTLVTLIAVAAARLGKQSQKTAAPIKPPAQAGLAGHSSTNAAAERVLLAKFIPPPVPDDQNFATTPFFAVLFDKRRRGEADRRWPDDFSRADKVIRNPPLGRPTGRFTTDLRAWKRAFEETGGEGTGAAVESAETVEPAANAAAALTVLTALKVYEPVLEELRSASHRPYSRFNLGYDTDDPWGIAFPHLAVTKRTCQLLRLKTAAELAAGHSEQAAADALLMLYLTDASRPEPTLISQLVRMANFNITLQPLWEGLRDRRWSEAQLHSLQERLAELDFLADLQRVFEAERAWGHLTIGLVRDRRAANEIAALANTEQGVEEWVHEADRALGACSRECFDQEQTNHWRLYEEHIFKGIDLKSRTVLPRVTEAHSQQVEALVSDTSRLVQDRLVFAKLLIPAAARAHFKFVQAQAYVDLVVVATALERYRLAQGAYPDQLAALSPRFLKVVPHDLINGKPLRYQRTDQGSFILYSVGWNGTDDGGEIKIAPSGRAVEPKQGDWVWSYGG